MKGLWLLRLTLAALHRRAVDAFHQATSVPTTGFFGCPFCRRSAARSVSTTLHFFRHLDEKRSQGWNELLMTKNDDVDASGEASTTDSLQFEVDSADDLPEEAWQELEEGQPSEWMIMKDLLGINAFTYVLAAAIAFFLGMNALLGPGWLGSSIGIQGTGDFTETSTSLPNTLDLGSNKDYLL